MAKPVSRSTRGAATSRTRARKPAHTPLPAPVEALSTGLLDAPSAWLMLLEGRAPFELAALFAAEPWLRQLPTGDGHPVLVFPGLSANDLAMLPLRHFLTQRGYTAYPWKQGFNFGPREGVLQRCLDEFDAIAQKHGEPVSLIGWSLGGIYARELAKERVARTRCVITLGTPFTGHPYATNAWRLYEVVSGQKVHEDPALIAQIRRAPPVPTTSIYSRTDGVVAWQCSINDPAPRVENIRVHASHLGLSMNPTVLFAVADRLAQDPAAWRPFDAQGMRRWLFDIDAQG